jgi:hypothetical protein
MKDLCKELTTPVIKTCSNMHATLAMIEANRNEYQARLEDAKELAGHGQGTGNGTRAVKPLKYGGTASWSVFETVSDHNCWTRQDKPTYWITALQGRATDVRLILNLPPNSVLVIDNAPYHNVQLNREPNSNSRRDFLISWLKYHLPPITFNNTDFPSMQNPDIYNMILPLKLKNFSYKVDGIVAEHNHNILRLPPYHPELNPTELIWAPIRNGLAQNNTTFGMDDIIKLADQKLASISAEDWQRTDEHVRNTQQQLMAR